MEALTYKGVKSMQKQKDNKTSLSKNLRDLENSKKRMEEGLIVFWPKVLFTSIQKTLKIQILFRESGKFKYDINIISALMKLYSKMIVSEIIPI